MLYITTRLAQQPVFVSRIDWVILNPQPLPPRY
jgi:hypothetical protein